jgi:hypothetical protein
VANEASDRLMAASERTNRSGLSLSLDYLLQLPIFVRRTDRSMF